MDGLLEILNGMDDTIAWEKETALIDEHILDSFAIITLVSEISDTFGVDIDASELVPANFNSVKAIYAMIQRLEA